jgi:streptogramin lyase
VPANAVGVVDEATGKVAGSVAVGSSPGLVAYEGTPGTRQVWVANTDDQTLTRIDATTRTPRGPVISLGTTPAGLAVGFGSVWVLDKDAPRLLRIDPDIGRTTGRVDLPFDPQADWGYFPAGLAIGAGSVWAAYDGPGHLIRVDPASSRTS